MEQSIDSVRRRVLSVHMSDGILELYLGFVLTMIGLLELHQHFGDGEGMTATMTPLIVVIPMFLMFIAKRNVIQKRIGFADMSGSRHRTNRLHLVLVVVIALALAAVTYWMQARGLEATEGTAGHKPYVGLYFGIFVMAILSTLGVMIESRRLHLESLLFLVVFALLFAMKLYTGFGFLITGVALLVIGTCLLVRFLRENPILPPEDYERPAPHAEA